jgi:hypothetical protein
MDKFFLDIVFISFGYIHRSRIAASYGNFVFKDLRNCQNAFQSVHTTLHPTNREKVRSLHDMTFSCSKFSFPLPVSKPSPPTSLLLYRLYFLNSATSPNPHTTLCSREAFALSYTHTHTHTCTHTHTMPAPAVTLHGR